MSNWLDKLNEWRPDWRKAESYDHLDNKTASEIYAWEFLRRNLTYQTDYELNRDLIKERKFCFIERPVAETVDGKTVAWKENMRNWYGLSFHFQNYDPTINIPPRFDHTVGQPYPYITVPSEPSSEIYIFEEKSNTKGYKNFALLPACEDSEIKNEIIINEFSLSERVEPGEFNALISAEADLEAQIKVIEKFHTQHKKKLDQQKLLDTEDKKKYYKRHIRILDALFSEGSTDEEVSQELIDQILYIVFPRQDRDDSLIKGYIEKARMLRDGGYIRIIGGKIKHPRPDNLTLERLLRHPNKPNSFKVDLKNLNWSRNYNQMPI